MIRNFKLLAPWLVVAAAVWWLWPQSALRHPAGVRVSAQPVQHGIAPQKLPELHGYTLTAVATYAIEARVLRTKRYWADADDLSPYDVALGWGGMSDQAVLDRLKISQGNRFFFYEWRDQPPLPLPEIIANATNVHVIAADSVVAKAVRRLRAGQFVRLRGYLVNVSRPDGFHWNTSLRRDDSGKGACELFYVQEIEVNDTLG